MARKKKIEFLMNTDWMFEKPIDREYKEYKLLSYFQKMGDKLDKLELYPGFIELSLHLMNVQALMRDHKIVYTDKKLNHIDDEIMVKDLKVKEIQNYLEGFLQNLESQPRSTTIRTMWAVAAGFQEIGRAHV